MRTPLFPIRIAGLLSFFLGWMAAGATPGSPSEAQRDPPPLRTVMQIRTLGVAQAGSHAPVRIRGVVTLYDGPQRFLFVQDRTAGIFVETDRDLGLTRGALVEVEGVTEADYTNMIIRSAVRVLGRAPEPQPRQAGFHEIEAGDQDCNLVTLTGVVHSATASEASGELLTVLQITTPHGTLDAQMVGASPIQPSRLVGSTVRITGVAGGYFNDLKEFIGAVVHLRDAHDMVVLRLNAPDPFRAPLRHISELLRYRTSGDLEHRVRVAGVVTLSERGHALGIQEGNDALLVSCAECPVAQLGDRVEVVGLPVPGNYRPTLESPELRILRHGPPLLPRPLDLATSLSGKYSDVLVSVEANVIGVGYDAGKPTLHLAARDTSFHAAYVGDNHGDPDLKPGSRVRVTGLCIMHQGGIWKAPESFSLMIRSPRDIKVLAQPSWWNPRHLVYFLAAATCLAFAVMFWITSLRRQVRRQREQILQSAKLQRDRSDVLELVSGFKPMPLTIAAIERLVRHQLPGLSCAVLLGEPGISARTGTLAGDSWQWIWPVFSAANEHLGAVVLSLPGDRGLDPRNGHNNFVEVQEIACGLVSLSVEHRKLYDQLTFRSQHDPLTAIPNRQWIEAHLDSILTAALARGEKLGLAFIDLDGFKEVNDEHGHKVGDEYLSQVVRRFRRSLTATEVLARWGGDEFILISPGLSAREEAAAAGQRLSDALCDPFWLNGIRFRATASIGVVVSPDDDVTPEGLCQKADQAMYAAKIAGRDRIRVYTRDQFEGRAHDLVSASDLRDALENGHFRLLYQPQFAVGRRLIACEALLRLHHPTHGLVSPEGFLPIAERSRLVIPIGRWALQEACLHARDWAQAFSQEIRVCLKLTAAQFTDPDFPASVRETLSLAGLPPHLLELEVAEAAVLKNVTSATQQTQALRRMGARLAIHNFGAGELSMEALCALSPDTLKLDPSFLERLHRESDGAPALRATLASVSRLGAFSVIEGVDDPADIAVLTELGCDALQGFALSKPLSRVQLFTSIESWTRAPGEASRECDAIRTGLSALAQSVTVSTPSNHGQESLPTRPEEVSP